MLPCGRRIFYNTRTVSMSTYMTASLNRDFDGALAALDMVVGVRAERSAARNSPDAMEEYMRLVPRPRVLAARPSSQSTRVTDSPTLPRRLGLQETAKTLKVVHIAGSKGKGSTSAMCEAAFRAAGLSTALFSSPHLIDVRERIRLNGQLIEKDVFVKHFWEVWELLEAPQSPGGGPSATAEVYQPLLSPTDTPKPESYRCLTLFEICFSAVSTPF